jgi:hypothetical protein
LTESAPFTQLQDLSTALASLVALADQLAALLAGGWLVRMIVKKGSSFRLGGRFSVE